jgi:hypothetical protein
MLRRKGNAATERKCTCNSHTPARRRGNLLTKVCAQIKQFPTNGLYQTEEYTHTTCTTDKIMFYTLAFSL